MSSTEKIAVLGAGISGLSCAWWIQKSNPSASIHIYEKGNRTGGKIHSVQKQGFVLENGPHVLLNNRNTTAQILQDISTSTKPFAANSDGMTNYVYHKGRLKKYPRDILSFIWQNPMSPLGLLRLLLEPFVSNQPQKEDESVADFSRRRFGREFSRLFIDPLMNGIYGTTMSGASIKTVLPKYYYTEKKSGSVARGFLAEIIKQPGLALPGTLKAEKTLSFTGGLKEFSDGIENQIKISGAEVFTGKTITSISKRQNKITVQTEDSTEDYDGIVSCLPALDFLKLVEGASPEAASLIRNIDYVPLVVVYLGYKKSQVKHLTGGFGFLVPSHEKRKTNGCVYLSRVFDHKAPDDSEIFSLQMGGANYPDVIGLTDEELIDLAIRELKDILGITSKPYFTHAIKHIEALPVFRVGHEKRVHQIESLLQRDLPGVIIGGSGFFGTGIEKCIENSKRSAEKLERFIRNNH